MIGLLCTTGLDTYVNEPDDGSIHSAHCTSSVEVKTGTQENLESKLYIEDLTTMGFEHDHIPTFDLVYANLSSKRGLANSDNNAGYVSSECFSPSSAGAKGGDSLSIKAPQLYKQDADNLNTVMDCIPQNDPFINGYVDLNDGRDSFVSELWADASNNEVSSGTLRNQKDALKPLSDVPTADTEGFSVGFDEFKEQKDTNNTDTGYNEQSSGDVVEDGDILLSSKTDMLPDRNLNRFASTASTHSSHSVSIESLEGSIADARSNKVIFLTIVAVSF
jgi:hypothetical protein